MITEDQIIDGIILAEGVQYTDDPSDKGGPTKFGITLITLTRFRSRPCTAEDVKNLSIDEAIEIYRQVYLKPFQRLADPLRVNCVDMGVNAGIRRGIILLQHLIGAKVDGVAGDGTARVANAQDWNDEYCIARVMFYESIIEREPTQIKWRNGWRSRAFSFSSVFKSPLSLLSVPVRVGKAYVD